MVTLETLYAQPNELRAVEVALAGGYSLAFIPERMTAPEAVTLPVLAAVFEPSATFATLAPCACQEFPCICTPEALAAYRVDVLTPEQSAYDMVMRLAPQPPQPPEYIDPRYADTQIRARIAEVKARPAAQMSADAQEFLAYHRLIQRIEDPWPKITQIAGTIAQMRGSAEIERVDMAEAIMYRLVKLP